MASTSHVSTRADKGRVDTGASGYDQQDVFRKPCVSDGTPEGAGATQDGGESTLYKLSPVAYAIRLGSVKVRLASVTVLHAHSMHDLMISVDFTTRKAASIVHHRG